MTVSAYACYLVIGAGLLSSATTQVSGQDVPFEEFCTPMVMAGCYVVYDAILWDRALAPDHDDHFNNTAYHIACSEIKEKSPCHKTNENCPQKAAMDLTRQEKGYQLMRDFVCDFGLFRDFQRALRCEDSEKMTKCNPPPPEIMKLPPVNPKGQLCRAIIDEWVCREQSLRPGCYAPYKRAIESYSKVREAVALLRGCDYDASAISSQAPHSVTPSSEANPSATAPSEAPSSEGPSSTGHPSVAPPSLAPPSVAPLGFLFYMPTLALLRWMNNLG